MGRHITQLSYNSGEIGELLKGRVDDSKYASGLAQCVNAYPTPQGPVMNRAGFVYVNEVKDSSKQVRLIPFVYSADQQIVIELGNYYARFHLNGQTLMTTSGAPYEISTPWRAERLFDIHYTQNADIMTLVCSGIAPQELRRYSINDWRINPVRLQTTLTPPTNVSAYRVTSAAEDKNAETYTQRYKVTALNKDRTEESLASSEASVVANLYATGTTVRISWSGVDGAAFYRVYKYQGGVFGYIGETQGTSVDDDNIAPETGTTPPYVDDIFGTARGISSVRIVNGGSGYINEQRVAGALTTGQHVSGPNWKDALNRQVDGKQVYKTTLPFDMGKYWPPTAEGLADKYDGTYDQKVDIYDANGSGSGGKARIVFDNPYSRHFVLSAVRILEGGTGYVRPVVPFELYDWHWEIEQDSSGDSPSNNYKLVPHVAIAGYIDCVTEETPVRLEVYDEGGPGYGATLGFAIKNGVFTDVFVKTPGQDYSNPKVRVISQHGSGASFSLSTASVGDYPTAVGYFEQRRIFAGSPQKPQQIWMSATGTDSNMTYHLPLQDTDRISFGVAARDLNQIQHVVPLQQLIALTSAGEWRVSPLNSDAITPSSISVRPQSYVGASKVQPQIINSNLIYAAARGGHIRELAYEYSAGGYITGDLSIRAPHLFSEDNVVTDMALTKSPNPILWCVRQDGELLGLSYVPEQKIGAWFQYTTNGYFESAAVVQEGQSDYLYVVVKRRIGNEFKRFIERQSVRDSDTRLSCYLDCSGYYASDTETTTVSGLTWLEGMTVTAVADGAVYEGLTVKDGKIELPLEARNIWVGLPYVTLLETLPVSTGAQDASYGRGYIKNVRGVSLRLKSTSGIEVGPTETTTKPIKARSMGTYGTAPELITDTVDVTPLGCWQADGSFVIRQAEPLPFTLICHSTDVVIGDE